MIGLTILEAATSVAVKTEVPFDHIGLGSVITIAMFMLAIGGYLLARKKDRRDDADDAQDRTDRIMGEIGKVSQTFETRVDRLEQSNRQFMPKPEIEKGFDHERAGRDQMGLALKERLDRHEARIGEMAVAIGKVEQAHKNLDDDVSEIKDILKDQRKEQNERLDRQDGKLDKINDCLNTISKKVG